MRRLFIGLIIIAVLAAGLGLFITRPRVVAGDDLADLAPDTERGAFVFTAAGCASCHSSPEAEGEDKLVLAGGRAFASDFGTFFAPNISPSSAGIAGWSAADLASALQHGTSPGRQHYYPAFPYTSYARMTDADVVALWAYMQTLPVSDAPSRDHDVGFPFNIRLSLGGWKMLFFNRDWVIDGDLPDPVSRGRYLVEALGHCGECHTPRNALGGLDRSRWLAGAPNPSGRGRIPNITPGKLDWSEADIVAYFQSGFTPEFDSVGGEMAAVVDNLKQLPEEDLNAIAAYLKAVAPVNE